VKAGEEGKGGERGNGEGRGKEGSWGIAPWFWGIDDLQGHVACKNLLQES